MLSFEFYRFVNVFVILLFIARREVRSKASGWMEGEINLIGTEWRREREMFMFAHSEKFLSIVN